jgi:hypothetical protein
MWRQCLASTRSLRCHNSLIWRKIAPRRSLNAVPVGINIAALLLLTLKRESEGLTMRTLLLTALSTAIVFVLATALTGCYTQLGSVRDESELPEVYQEPAQLSDEETSDSADSGEYFDDEGYPRHRFYFSYYYPYPHYVGVSFYDPWYWPYCGYSLYYYDPFWWGWCGTRYPVVYPIWYSSFDYYPHYYGHYSYSPYHRKSVGHGITRTIGRTRGEGSSRGREGYGNRETQKDIPPVVRAGSSSGRGSVSQSTGPKVSTSQRGSAVRRSARGTSGTRGGTTRSGGGREGTRVSRPKQSQTPPQDTGGGNRGAVRPGGGRSVSSPPPPRSTPPSAPPANQGGNRGGGNSSGGRGGNRR